MSSMSTDEIVKLTKQTAENLYTLLTLVANRLEEVEKENKALKERIDNDKLSM